MKLLEDVMVEVNGGESKDDRGHEFNLSHVRPMHDEGVGCPRGYVSLIY
jgi:hypothetical protein